MISYTNRIAKALEKIAGIDNSKGSNLNDTQRMYNALETKAGMTEDEKKKKKYRKNTERIADALDIIAENPSGDEPTGSIRITENGTWNVKNVAEAEVEVPTGKEDLGELIWEGAGPSFEEINGKRKPIALIERDEWQAIEKRLTLVADGTITYEDSQGGSHKVDMTDVCWVFNRSSHTDYYDFIPTTSLWQSIGGRLQIRILTSGADISGGYLGVEFYLEQGSGATITAMTFPTFKLYKK